MDSMSDSIPKADRRDTHTLVAYTLSCMIMSDDDDDDDESDNDDNDECDD